MALSWLLVIFWTILIFWGSGTTAPDEPISQPMTKPIIEPIVEPINEARNEPLPGPGYDKVDHACEYGVLGALLWLALALTARWERAPPWLARLKRGCDASSGGGRQVGPRSYANRISHLLSPLVLLAALLTSLYGVTDELHQHYEVERTADVLDWLADTIGGLLGAMVMALLGTATGRQLISRGYFQADQD